ncbi:anti-repressor SinI family protein [Cytobacillus horneckiae]
MKLDNEWVELIIEAKALGITIDEVRLFFESKKPFK